MPIKKRPLYVNIGCGSNIVPSTKEIEWLNIDRFIGCDAPNFREGDLLNLPLEKESVDYILLDQVLEHIRMQDIPAALHEIKRVLKRGGKAIIIVPDFKGAIKQWLAVDHDKGFNPYYYHFLSEVIYGNQMHDGEYHKTAMSPGFLHYSLAMVGLINHKIEVHPENNPIPIFPGIYESYKKAVLRNAQIVCIVNKE